MAPSMYKLERIAGAEITQICEIDTILVNNRPSCSDLWKSRNGGAAEEFGRLTSVTGTSNEENLGLSSLDFSSTTDQGLTVNVTQRESSRSTVVTEETACLYRVSLYRSLGESESNVPRFDVVGFQFPVNEGVLLQEDLCDSEVAREPPVVDDRVQVLLGVL